MALAWWGWTAPARRLRAATTSARRQNNRSADYTTDLLASRQKISTQHTVAAAIRLALWILLILALAGSAWRFTARHQAVAFAVDVSASVQGRESAITEFLRRAADARVADDQAAVVAIGRTAMVDSPLGPELIPGPVATNPGADYTNLAEGLRLAGSLLPEGNRRRVVLISDGHENVGSALEQARALAAQGIRVDVVPLESRRGPEVMVAEVKAPPYAFTGEDVPVTAAIRASEATRAKVRLYAGQAQVGEQEIELQPGLSQVSFKVPAASSGFQSYRVEVEAEGDTRPENNTGAAITRISGTPAVLVVAANSEDSAAIKGALVGLGVQVDERPPEAMPGGIEDLQAYAAVVLANVPAHTLHERVMANLESYVRDTGGGLMMIGGEDSYGLGAYHGTPIERALPVYMDIKGRGEIPSLGLILVIDKSGSMGFLPRFGSPTKMELAKEAAIRTVDVMTDQDLFGVIAFDAAAGWVVDLGPTDDKAEMQRAIGRIFQGGGTNIYPGVEMAYYALRGALVKSKHIILLTDGVSSYGGNYETLTRQMRESGVTLTSVAVGNDSDIFLLQQLARWGRGRFYYTDDGENVPSIFAKETVLATRSYVIEQLFSPIAAAPSPLLRGIGSVPTLLGYVAARAKEAAEVALVSHEQDPILAHWQFGLGRAVAWTPDLTGRWARPWIGSPELQQLLSNTVSWMMRPDDRSELQVRAIVSAGRATIQVETPIEEGGGRATHAAVTDPDLNTQEVLLRTVAPGQYVADLDVEKPGAYVIQIEQQGSDGAVHQTGAGFVVPFSPEYSVVGVNWHLLEQVAAAGGGQILTDPVQAFARNLPPVGGQVELWPGLLAAAALLWPLDIALRRLVIRPQSAKTMLVAISARLTRGRSAVRTALAAGINDRRNRQRRARKELARAVDEAAPSGETGLLPNPPRQTQSVPTFRSTPAASVPLPVSLGSHAARLLAAKRRKQGN